MEKYPLLMNRYLRYRGSMDGKERHHRPERQFLSAIELEALTGIARKTWLAGGAGTSAIPKVRFERSVRWPREAVEGWLRERLYEAELASKEGEAENR
jgi:predicted DNA-binding transcriptional regulator AlpA